MLRAPFACQGGGLHRPGRELVAAGILPGQAGHPRRPVQSADRRWQALERVRGRTAATTTATTAASTTHARTHAGTHKHERTFAY